MAFDGYIFDVEGTLVDCVPQNILSLQEGLAKFGISAPFEFLRLYSGLDGDQALQIVAPDLKKAERKTVLQEKAKIYETKYLKSVSPFYGVRDVVESLKQKGGTIAIATDCKGPELRWYRSILKIDDLIDAIACGDDVEHGKPDPRLVGLAIRKLGVLGSRSIVIGDTPYDAEAAGGAGAAAAGLLTGGFGKEALLEAGCIFVASEFKEIPASLAATMNSGC